MAEKVIGLRIQLNGIDKVITDIETLEVLIKEAKQDLKDVEIGGPIFKELSTQIGTAEAALAKLNEKSKALSPEKTLQGFGKLATGITSAFAAGTAALSLFGAESESTSRLAAKAQNLLTVALSVKGIAEIRTGALIVARTIAEKAGTLATNAANGATKAFFATLAANPIGAILVVVGLLIAAYISLTEETYDAETAQKQYNKSLETTILLYSLERQAVQDSLALKLKIAERDGQSIEELAQIKRDAINETLAINKKETDALVSLRITRQQEISKNIKDEKERNIAIRELADQISKEGRRLGVEDSKLRNDLRLLEIDLEIQQAQRVKRISGERRALLEKDIALYGALLDYQAKLTVSSYKLGEADAKVLTQAKARIDNLERLRLKTIETLTAEEQFKLKLNETFGVVEDKAGKAFTVLINEFESFSTKALTTAKSSKELKDQLQALPTLAAGFKDFFKDSISEDTAKQIDKLAANYEQLGLILFDISKAKIEPPFDIPAFRKAFKELSDLETESVIFGPEAALRIRENAEKQKQQFIRAYVELQKVSKEGQEKIAEIQKLSVPADRDAALKALTDSYKKAGETFFDGLKASVLEVEKFNTGIGTTAAKVELLNTKIKELASNSELLGAFLLENRELFAKAYDVDLSELATNRERAAQIIEQVSKKTYDQEKKFIQDVADFEKKLKEQGVDIAKLTYAQKLELLKDALAAETTEIITADAEQAKDRDKKIIEIQQYLSATSSALSQIQSFVQQGIQLRLDALKKSSEEEIKAVIGDTEQANQKRLELEEQYQKKKLALEKTARVKSLELQLVQAIVDTASAVVANLKFPPLAVAVGILGAIQIGIIQQQIAAARSMVTGGKIKVGAGGMVIGPSHEQGGVSFGAGGLNLEGGESVINKQSSLNYGSLLSQINQSGGGQPIVNNATGSLAEERLIQAMNKMVDKPIRAYVMGSEIESSVAINNRLNALSTI